MIPFFCVTLLHLGLIMERMMVVGVVVMIVMAIAIGIQIHLLHGYT